MTILPNIVERERLLFRFNEMRELLLVLAKEKMCRDIQAKIGASDIVQQTMLEAYLHVDSFKPKDDRHIFNWLSKILLNNVRDLSKSFRIVKKRSVGRERRLRSDGNIADRKQTAETLELQEQIDLLGRALGCLPLAHQQILTWRYHEQMTFPEIAILVGRSEDAVRMIAKRALHRLGREMSIDDHATKC